MSYSEFSLFQQLNLLSDSRDTAKFPTPSSSTMATSPASHATSVLSAPAPQILRRATLSKAQNSNVWVLTFHPLSHLLVSASNDHTTRFWARERPSDAASVFAPGGAKPAAAGPDDDAEDEDNAHAVPVFGSSTSVAVAGVAGGWWNSADTMGGAHGRVGPGVDDDIVVDSGEAASAAVRYPGWAVAGVG
jgi:hypothetical protein